MGVRTTADERLDEAREHIREARRMEDFREGTVLPAWLKLREIERDL